MTYEEERAKYLQAYVQHVDIKAHNVCALVDAMAKMSFSSRDLSVAAKYYEQMVCDPRCTIFLGPLRLVIGSVGAADFGAFVPVDSQPSKAGENRLQSFLNITLLVGVVDAQNELPVVMPGEQPVEQSSPHTADMKVARRAGCKSSSNGHD